MKIVLTSDMITNDAYDIARMEELKTGLVAKGHTVTVYKPVNPNSHITVFQSADTPDDALVVNIYGGADAGLIYEMGGTWFKSIVGKRKVMCLWIPPSVDISKLTYLERAWDDNYSPESFKGLS